ncbi:MAG: aldo/keto reductase [Candidatus Neomarinimicrobiota bacterium]
MKYRPLGRSGLSASEISLGGWLTLGGSVDEAVSVRLIQYAFYRGINLFDVADVYSDGRAEVVLGKAVKELPREQVVLATKVFGRMHAGPHGSGLSKKHILQACEASLTRLKVDTIDLYQFHAPHERVHLEESLEAMDILVRQGKVLYAGCSNFSAEDILHALDIATRLGFPRFISNQPRYNMLDRTVENDLFPLCEAEGIGNMVYSPLAHGILTGKYKTGVAPPDGSRLRRLNGAIQSRYLTGENLGKVEKITSIADRLGTTTAAIALAWILRRSEVSSAIVGATSIEQLDENIEASDLELSEEVMRELERIVA